MQMNRKSMNEVYNKFNLIYEINKEKNKYIILKDNISLID